MFRKMLQLVAVFAATMIIPFSSVNASAISAGPAMLAQAKAANVGQTLPGIIEIRHEQCYPRRAGYYHRRHGGYGYYCGNRGWRNYGYYNGRRCGYYRSCWREGARFRAHMPWYNGYVVGYGGGGGYYYGNPNAYYYADGYGYGYGHVEWCLNRYRSYNPRTDTYLGYDGHRHLCRGP